VAAGRHRAYLVVLPTLPMLSMVWVARARGSERAGARTILRATESSKTLIGSSLVHLGADCLVPQSSLLSLFAWPDASGRSRPYELKDHSAKRSMMQSVRYLAGRVTLQLRAIREPCQLVFVCPPAWLSPYSITGRPMGETTQSQHHADR